MMQSAESNSRYLRFTVSSGVVVIESSEDVPGAGPVSQRGLIEDTGKRLATALEQLGGILAPLREQVKKQLAEAEQVRLPWSLA